MVNPFADEKVTDFEAMTRIWKWIYNIGFNLAGKSAPTIHETLAGACPRPKSQMIVKPEEHPIVVAGNRLEKPY